MSARSLRIFLLLLAPLPATAADPTSSDNQISVDPAVQHLDAVTSRMTAFLRAVPSFRVETMKEWTLAGARGSAGSTHYGLSVQHPAAFRLEIAAHPDEKPTFICASDGKTLTRFYHVAPFAIFSRQEGGIGQLLEDAMTDSSLKGCGLDVILRADAHRYIMASVSKVKDCGEERVQGRPAHHFSADWFGGSHVDFWIAADREPVLLRWKRTQTLDLGDESREMQVVSELKWKLDSEFSDAETVIDMPPDAIEVRDLQTYLLQGGTDRLLGKPAPSVALKLLDGSDWDPEKHRGEGVVVLFFFATWATPSTQDMPAVLESIRKYESRGVVFYAVAAGEPPKIVRDFVASQKYTHPVVLDPELKAAAAYRVTSLPVTVLIGKDGTLQAVHVGISPEDRALIRQDLEQLLEGKQLVEAKR